MLKKIGVAIIHGIGRQTPDFALKTAEELKDLFAKRINEYDESIDDPASLLVVKRICWAGILEEPEEKLCKIIMESDLDKDRIRKFVIHAFADAISYQKASSTKNYYKKIHETIDQKLIEIVNETGDDETPLCVIAHSLGSVIAINHFHDLQNGKRSKEDLAKLDHPLAKGETLTLLYTMGSPIALWSIGYDEFDHPIQIPNNGFKKLYPDVGEWINFYDKDDIIAYPLGRVYGEGVVKDKQVNAGGLHSGWNLLSHVGYWKDKDVLKPIIDGLFNTWIKVNEKMISIDKEYK